ncbi:hypothetical protein MKW98_030060 [Papaver atlanticum]|uniref:Pentatricopeptide repeat-containing protein n=1 Tax=Papaver atlanticum TaxID=357466 RepID=A0AAD4XPQ3_9MAGN|nr:hypothetical protein MKW98_030060 [Papaver atlanticum]
MWRSKARSILLRCSIQSSSASIQNKVLQSKSLTTLIESSSFHFSRLISLSSQNPRFYSNDSNVNQDDEVNVFDETPPLISPESLDPFSVSDENDSQIETSNFENPNFVSQSNDTDTTSSESEVELVVDEQIEVVDVEKLESVLQFFRGVSSLDGSIEESLEKMNLDVNEEFGLKLIQTPNINGHHLISFVRWASQKDGSFMTSRIVDALVKAIGDGLRPIEKKEVYSLWDLIKEIGEKREVVLNTEILNGLIASLYMLGRGKAAKEVFDKFEEFGCDPDGNTYYFTVEALCNRKIFDGAWVVCDKMLNSGKLPDEMKIGKMIVSLCKGYRAKDAHMVYLMAKEKNKCLPMWSVNFLINGLCRKSETVKLAREVLQGLSGDSRKLATKCFNFAVRALCQYKDIEGAKELLFEMIKEGPAPGHPVFNSVITALSKSGELEEALKLVKVMESRKLRPNIYTYTVIINGYVKGGQMDEAIKILEQAKKTHRKLTSDPYHILIRGYCQLEETDKALNLLTEMKESGIVADENDYKDVIRSLCLNTLDWETAEKLLEEMKENGMCLSGNSQGLIKAVKELQKEESEAPQESIAA